MAEKWFEIAVPVTGFEYYTVQADTFEEATAYIRSEGPAPDNTEVEWSDDFEINDEWED